jgi:hypothetical protein
MTHHLVVTKPFLNYVRGDIIVDVLKISEILASEQKKFVTRVALSTTSKG